MNAAYISALSALAGSAIGAIASFMTTWLTQNRQDFNQRVAQAAARRERLYGDFIDEASKIFADALGHELDTPDKIVPLYAIRSKLRLFAPDAVTEQADQVLERIFEAYSEKNVSVRDLRDRDQASIDILRTFTECCREDLRG